MSSKTRLVITAIEVEGRTPAEVCATYGALTQLQALNETHDEGGGGQ